MNIKPPQPGIFPVTWSKHVGSGRFFPSIHAGLSGVILVSLVVRLLALSSWTGSLYGDFMVPEERMYHEWASAMTSGTASAKVPHGFGMLYADIMAAVYHIFSVDIFYVRILNIFFGVAACVFVYFIGRKLAGPVAGFFAGLIAGLYKPFIFVSVVLMDTSLTIFLFALTCHLFLCAVHKTSWFGIVLVGVCSGLLICVRIHFIWILPVLLCAMIAAHCRRGACLKTAARIMMTYAAGAAISMAPFMAADGRTGEFRAALAAEGFDFYAGWHSDDPSAYHRPVSFASSCVPDRAHQFIIEASRRTHRKLSHGEASAYWISETFRWAVEHPGSFFAKTGLKILAVFHRFEAADDYHIGFISRDVRFFRCPFFEIWMLLPFAMAAMAVGGISGKTGVLLVPALFYAVDLVLFFTDARTRLPLMVVLIPLAVIGVKHFLNRMASGSKKAAFVYPAVLLLFFMVTFLPMAGAGDLTAACNARSLCLYAKGRTAEAVNGWELSSRMNGAFSSFAELSLAEHHFRRGELPEALRRLEKISDDSPAAARKYAKIGAILMQRKNVRGAAKAFESSLAINSGQEGVMRALAGIYRRLDAETAGRMREKQAYILSFYNTQ